MMIMDKDDTIAIRPDAGGDSGSDDGARAMIAGLQRRFDTEEDAELTQLNQLDDDDDDEVSTLF